MRAPWQRFPWQRSAPPPPPPRGVSLQEAQLGAALLCALLALLLHLLLRRRLRVARASPRVAATPLVSVSPLPAAADHSAVVTYAESELGVHTCRLLAARGYTVHAAPDAGDPELYANASLVVHLATQAGTPAAMARSTERVLGFCDSTAVPNVILLSDAAAGIDAARDLSDGDEGVAPAAVPHSDERLAALAHCESLVRAGQAWSQIVRTHRLYGNAPPVDLVHALVVGGGVVVAGARAYTSVTHVEQAALALVRAADGLCGEDKGSFLKGLPALVVCDGTTYSVAHLLRAASSCMALPPPILPLRQALRIPASLLETILGVGTPAQALRALRTHQFFSGAQGLRLLDGDDAAGAAPAAKVSVEPAQALRCAFGAWYTAVGLLPRLIVPLQSLSLLLLCDAFAPALPWLHAPACVAALVCALALCRLLLPPPRELPPQPPLLPVVVDGGLPLLGNLLEFIKGPVKVVAALRSQYRSLFTMMIGPQRITFMVGAEAQRSFLKATDKELDQAAVYGFTVPVFGPGVVYDSPLDERLQQVKMLVHSMNTSSLQAMIPKIVSEAETYFSSTWGDEGEVDLREAFAKLIILTASSTLMGKEIRQDLSEDVARIYHALDNGLTPFSVFFPRAPTAAHRKRDAARKEMVGIFSKVIKARRQSEEKERDFLQTMIDFRYKDVYDKNGEFVSEGQPLSDSQIVGLLIVLLFAGQHTSSITATWMGAMLLSHPDEKAKLEQEQKRVLGDGASSLNYEALMKLEGMRRAISESLRLFPPLVLLIRKVMAPRSVGSFTVPKGDIVMMCTPAGNMDERVWDDPSAFKPDRFAPGGTEELTWSSRTVEHGKQGGAMLSFGGGHHMCTGRRFGFLQVSTIWSILLRDFDLELVGPIPSPNYDDMVVGPDGPVNVRYKRKKKPSSGDTPAQM